MPADFESGFFGGGVPAWHGLGVVIEEDVVTAWRAIELAELDWLVELAPVYCDFQGKRVGHELWRAVQRQSDGSILGMASKSYRPVQNRDAFEWCDALVDSGEAKYHTAGALRCGQDVWLLAKAPHGITVGGIESEQIDKYLLVYNSHSGRKALRAKWTRVRVVCANTLSAALLGDGNEIAIRHTGSIEGKLAEARRVLEVGFAQDAEFADTAEKLLATKLTAAKFAKFLDGLVPLPADVNPDKDRAARNKQEARDAIARIYNGADNLGNVRGTAWAAYNAVAEWYDHTAATKTKGDEATRMENRMRRIVEDTKVKDKALALLTA